MEKTPIPNQPLETLRDGRLKATLWENRSDNGIYHTVTLAKTYEDKDGQLKETHSFTGSELLRIAELVRESHGLIRSLRRDLNQERSAEPEREESPQPAKEMRKQADVPERFAGRDGPSMER